MTLRCGVDDMLLLWLIGVQLWLTGVDAETMCLHSDPMISPKTLTTFNYPVAVTASQCACKFIVGHPIEELNIHIQLKRSDQTNSCSRTQITIVYRNISSTICPSDTKQDGSMMMESLSLAQNDRPVITLWNTHLELISAQIIITSEHPVSYNVTCAAIDGSFNWPLEDQGLGFDDGIDVGIKVAVVVLFFVLAILISATIRLIRRLKRRKANAERSRQTARQKRIHEMKQVQAFENLGLSVSSLNHSSGNGSANPAGINVSYGKVSQNGDFQVANSASQSKLLDNSTAQKSLTGHGCVWALHSEELYQRLASAGKQEFHPNLSSKPAQTSSSIDFAVKPASKYHQAPSTSSYLPQFLEENSKHDSSYRCNTLSLSNSTGTGATLQARSQPDRSKSKAAPTQSEGLASVHSPNCNTTAWRKNRTPDHPSVAIGTKTSGVCCTVFNEDQIPTRSLVNRNQMNGDLKTALHKTVDCNTTGNTTTPSNRSSLSRETEI